MDAAAAHNEVARTEQTYCNKEWHWSQKWNHQVSPRAESGRKKERKKVIIK